MFIGIMLAAPIYGTSDLWNDSGMLGTVDFTYLMPKYRYVFFKNRVLVQKIVSHPESFVQCVVYCIKFFSSFAEIKSVFQYIFADPSREGIDDYWPVIAGVEGFNQNRKRTVAASRVKVADESMSPFKPSHKKYGDLPNLSYVAQKN